MKKKTTDQTTEQKEQVVADQETTDTATGQKNTEGQDAEQMAATVEKEIESLSREINDLKDKNLRLMAEFDNYRKRTLKEKSELILNGGEDVLKKLLPLVDDFERAIQAMETSTDTQAVKDGIDLIYAKLMSFLNENGVTAIPTENEDFNTDLHEAVTTFPAPSEEMKGKIIECISKGYSLREKVIRYSKVIVGE
ncbi:MAG: nucleotide exchange factor GrpE [Paludibacter sp.]|nr:nucleotide exchange factor GrpE [Paludibacter sp.]